MNKIEELNSVVEGVGELQTYLQKVFPPFARVKTYTSGTLENITVQSGHDCVLYRFKSDYRFSIRDKDLKSLVKPPFNMQGIQVNEEGYIDLYFPLGETYYGEKTLSFK